MKSAEKELKAQDTARILTEMLQSHELSLEEVLEWALGPWGKIASAIDEAWYRRSPFIIVGSVTIARVPNKNGPHMPTLRWATPTEEGYAATYEEATRLADKALIAAGYSLRNH